MVFERQIRTQIVAIPTANTTVADYNYGPFRQPNNLAPEIPGIVLSSPLWDYNPRKKQFRLCWSGYENTEREWENPSVCDNRLQNTGSLRRGLVWIPQNSFEGLVDNLITLHEYDMMGNAYYQYITAAKLDDGTMMMDFETLGQGGDGLGFEFRDTSTRKVPGTKSMAVSSLQSWLYWGRRTDEWERRSFYVCNHPDYGRSVFLANPYAQTTDPETWSRIPCQVCTLQARYWFEDKRQRDIRPLEERIHNLQQRDHEDPLNIRKNHYSTTHRNIPRRITFADEFGDVEPPWTTMELEDRIASEARGVEYVRPYILTRRAMERGEVTVDTFTNLDAPPARGRLGRNRRQPYNQPDILFEQLVGTIDELGDADGEHMRQVPIESSQRARGEERVVNMDLQRDALDRALDSVLRTGNRIALMALARSGVPLESDINADVLRDIGMEPEEFEGLDRIRQRQRQDQVQEVAEENEEPSSDEAWEDIYADITSSVSGGGSMAGGDGLAASMRSDVNPNPQVEPRKSTSQRCGRFLGRVCNSISAGVSNLLGWSQGSNARNQRSEQQQDFREPIELDVAGT
ncbi:hypothetical protein TWF481_006187 [Arthrobotrys musiformis]|uniref:WW domain-containing protein n=1 Tax=Arthrobotrys musiformis TaxID=47236 RepID=A0AAV9WFX5_9PEZI